MRRIKKEIVEFHSNEDDIEVPVDVFEEKDENIETLAAPECIKTETLPLITSWKTYPLYCYLCAYSTYKFSVLTTHVQSKHGSEIENVHKMKFQCIDCKKISDTYCNFLNHIRIHHANLKLCCDICSEFFENHKDLSRHHLKHKDALEGSSQPFVRYCTLCSKVYPSRVAVNKHILTHKGALECQDCEKSFKCLKYLKRHMEQHDDTKYACDFCDKTFARRFNKVCHERTHTGERPYECTKCNKHFSFSSTWKNHLRTHTGELPYKCDMCEAAFRHYDSLKEHKRIHTNEMPYQCTVCVKDFRFRKSLNRHMQELHTIRPDVKSKMLPLKKRPTKTVKAEKIKKEVPKKPQKNSAKKNKL